MKHLTEEQRETVIAGLSASSTRTVRKVLKGENIRSHATRYRIEQAVLDLDHILKSLPREV